MAWLRDLRFKKFVHVDVNCRHARGQPDRCGRDRAASSDNNNNNNNINNNNNNDNDDDDDDDDDNTLVGSDR